ncbi:hypothetical protein CR159_14975 [Pollutimonas subterranea]|uniref:Uncharacterized protein n=1 Tax=Pollutimonas subterranea TaxID=2045210 RepID=A0A2N4U215_9BURK|nr:hypothetical protein [Pollutimonas subterranea]PLC49062.1 hypothetical protein CR159_14975 [Pollutimonas subterranea]
MSELPETPANSSVPTTDRQKKEVSNVADHRPGQESATSSSQKDQDAKEKDRRTLGNHPVDPNAWPNKGNFPPGITPEEAADPGNAIPGTAPVDNRSGEQEKKK